MHFLPQNGQNFTEKELKYTKNMVIQNLWQDKIDQNVIELLTKYLEKRSGCGLKSGSSLPKEATRYVYNTFRNKFGEQCFRMETVTGVEEGRSTQTKFHTRIDEFGFQFRKLTDLEQICILIYCDPFDELLEKSEFASTIREHGFGKESHFYLFLEKAFEKLQNLCKKAGLIEREKIDFVELVNFGNKKGKTKNV